MARDLLDLEIRRRLLGLVRAYPGIHLREIARQLETSIALVQYHATLLAGNGLVREERGEHHVRLYGVAADADSRDHELVGLFRSRWPLRITLFLLDQDMPVQHKRIADALHVGKSKLSFHLRKLERAGVVERTANGMFAPVERKRLLRVLLEHKPVPALHEEVADLWLSLYGKGAA
ncbi:MAG: ArsR family transcriptional regulator [Thermoplasmatota archaeon]